MWLRLAPWRVCCSPWGQAFNRCLAEGYSLNANGTVVKILVKLDMKVGPKPISRVCFAKAYMSFLALGPGLLGCLPLLWLPAHLLPSL